MIAPALTPRPGRPSLRNPSPAFLRRFAAISPAGDSVVLILASLMTKKTGSLLSAMLLGGSLLIPALHAQPVEAWKEGGKLDGDWFWQLPKTKEQRSDR